MPDEMLSSTYKPPRADELQALDGNELASWTLAPGDIFFHNEKLGRVIRLKRAGDLLEQSWIEKMRYGSLLKWQPRVDVKRIEVLLGHWESWSAEEDPTNRERCQERFTEALRAGLHSEGGLSLMDWAFACHRLFAPDVAMQDTMLTKHVVLHRRGLYVSALSVLFALACGYSEPQLLREIYKVAWLLDAGLMRDEFTHWIALACQVEKAKPGSGIEFLKVKQATQLEQQLYLQHPQLGYDSARALLERGMSYPSLLNAILRHHELSDGKGFPGHLPGAALSDWEALIILADQLVDYRESVIEKYAAHGLREVWAEFRRLPVRNLPVERVRRKVAHWSAKGYSGSMGVSA